MNDRLLWIAGTSEHVVEQEWPHAVLVQQGHKVISVVQVGSIIGRMKQRPAAQLFLDKLE